jgi:hypothetical protein
MAMTFKDVRKMVLGLDGVEESTSYGIAASAGRMQGQFDAD